MSTQVLDYARGDFPRGRGTSPLATTLIMAVVLAPLAWITLGVPPMPFSPIGRLLSGQLFADRVVPWEQEMFHTLNPFVARDFFHYFAVIAVPTLLYVLAARWISDRSTPQGHLAFARPAAAVGTCLLVLLTIPYFWLAQYARSMGLTQARLNGLLCGAGAYVAIIGFFWWAIRGRPRGGANGMTSL